MLEAYGEGSLPLKLGASDRAFELAVLKFLETARDEAAAAAKPKAKSRRKVEAAAEAVRAAAP